MGASVVAMTPDEAYAAQSTRATVRDYDGATGTIDELQWCPQGETLSATIVEGADFRRHTDVLDLELA